MKVIGLALCVALAAFLPAAGSLHMSPVRAAPPAAASKCSNVQLLIQAQSSQGAAGHGAVIYRIHNMFGQACTLRGYPGVQLLDRHFLSLPTTVHRGAGDLVGPIPVKLITLPAHGNGYFALGFSDVPVGTGCEAPAHYVMIIPPNDHLPVVTYAFTGGGSFTACTGDVYVSPVTATPRYQ
jgi:hypothetical protein